MGGSNYMKKNIPVFISWIIHPFLPKYSWVPWNVEYQLVYSQGDRKSDPLILVIIALQD